MTTEFGFDDAGTVKNNAVELFKQSKSNQKDRVCIIAFKKISDTIIAKKAKEAGAPLSEAEKAEVIKKIDEKLAEKLKKSVSELTEVDRLDLQKVRFAFDWTHYKDGVGTIKCLSEREGATVTKAKTCCTSIGDAEQTIGTVIMTYPVNEDGTVDEQLLSQMKYVNFHVWKLSTKKYKSVETAYKDAMSDGRNLIDLHVKLDGEVKFQKQLITAASTPPWAKEGFNPEVRNTILEAGLRYWKHVGNNLGFAMSHDKLLEKLGKSPSALAGEAADDKPKLQSSYDDMLGLENRQYLRNRA